MKRARESDIQEDYALLDILPKEIVTLVLTTATGGDDTTDVFTTMACRLTCRTFNSIINDDLKYGLYDTIVNDPWRGRLPWWCSSWDMNESARRNLFSPAFYARCLRHPEHARCDYMDSAVVKAYFDGGFLVEAKEALVMYNIKANSLNVLYTWLLKKEQETQWLTDYMVQRFPQEAITIRYTMDTIRYGAHCPDVEWFVPFDFSWSEQVNDNYLGFIAIRVPYTVRRVLLQPASAADIFPLQYTTPTEEGWGHPVPEFVFI